MNETMTQIINAATTAASVAATIATTAVQQLAAEAPAAETKTE